MRDEWEIRRRLLDLYDDFEHAHEREDYVEIALIKAKIEELEWVLEEQKSTNHDRTEDEPPPYLEPGAYIEGPGDE